MDKMLKFTLKFLCDGQSAVRQAILYTDRSCCKCWETLPFSAKTKDFKGTETPLIP